MLHIKDLHWTEDAVEHIAVHHVTPDEAIQASRDVLYHHTSRGYILAVGRTAAGRYLTLILDHLGDDVYYPVTARDANRAERRQAEERAARRKR